MTSSDRPTTESGFTLIELCVVMVVLAVLAGIAIPLMAHNRERAHEAGARSDLRNIALAEEAFPGDFSSPYATAAQLLSTGDRVPVSPESTVWIYTDGSFGYCLVGHSGSSSSYLVFDSQHGGLQQTMVNSYADATNTCTSAGYSAAGSLVNDNGAVRAS